jgi:heterodisulfide reductase subunit B
MSLTYLYYPGCSLEGSARGVRSCPPGPCFAAAGNDIWRSCRSGPAAARARPRPPVRCSPWRCRREKPGAGPANAPRDTDVLVPCSACYLNLKKAVEKTREPCRARRHGQRPCWRKSALSVDEPTYAPGTFWTCSSVDIGARDLASPSCETSGCEGPRGCAPYYGCQCLRPYRVFDDPGAARHPWRPSSRRQGASGAFPWDVGGRCCGASNMTTKPEVGLDLVACHSKLAAQGRRCHRHGVSHVSDEPGSLSRQGLRPLRRRRDDIRSLPAPAPGPCHGAVVAGVGCRPQSLHYGCLVRPASNVGAGKAVTRGKG